MLRSVEISGNVFSSPEGHKFPERNLELSRKRAEVVAEIFKSILAERGIDASKIEVRLEGGGARGDVLDLVRAIESKIGKKFTGKGDEAKRDQAERLIRLMNEGKWDKVPYWLGKFTKGGQMSAEDLRKIFEETIAGQRRVDFKIVVKGKDLNLYVARQTGLKIPVKVQAERVIKEIEVPGGMKITIEIAKAVIPPEVVVPRGPAAERIVPIRPPKKAALRGRRPLGPSKKIPRAPGRKGRMGGEGFIKL